MRKTNEFGFKRTIQYPYPVYKTTIYRNYCKGCDEMLPPGTLCHQFPSGKKGWQNPSYVCRECAPDRWSEKGSNYDIRAQIKEEYRETESRDRIKEELNKTKLIEKEQFNRAEIEREKEMLKNGYQLFTLSEIDEMFKRKCDKRNNSN